MLVATALEFRAADGGAARVRGEFAAFTDPLATDLSVLGRDVLDNFDLILSRRHDEILLLAPPTATASSAPNAGSHAPWCRNPCAILARVRHRP